MQPAKNTQKIPFSGVNVRKMLEADACGVKFSTFCIVKPPKSTDFGGNSGCGGRTRYTFSPVAKIEVATSTNTGGRNCPPDSSTAIGSSPSLTKKTATRMGDSLFGLLKQDSNLRSLGYEHMDRVPRKPRKPAKSRCSPLFLPTIRRRTQQNKSSQSYRHSSLPIHFSPLPGEIPLTRESLREKSSGQLARPGTLLPLKSLKSPQLP